MRMTFVLPLLALGLAACQTYPQDRHGQGPYGYPEPTPYPEAYAPPALPIGQGDYRAIGTEPFWDLTIGRDLVFTDRGSTISVAEPAPPARRGVAGETYLGRRLRVNIVHARCSDGMSERSYPDTVDVTVDGRVYRGCGANAAFFARVGEDGGDRPRHGEHDLSNTNWRVVAINGQPLPRSGYYFNFAPDRVSGRLGCNSIGGGYTVAGSTLRAGALMMTRMACPEMQFEAQGMRIMGQPMTLSESGDRLTLSNRAGTIEMIRAR